MNTDKAGKIILRCFPRLQGTGVNPESTMGLRVLCGCGLSVKLAKAGCLKWSVVFFEWAYEVYQPWLHEVEDCHDNKFIELSLIDTAVFIQQSGGLDYFDDPMWTAHTFPVLSDRDWNLAWDAKGRGLPATSILFPPGRNRRRNKAAKIMTAAQTIANYANDNSESKH